MCGIYGKINFNQNSFDTIDELRLMMAESEYRGPDSQQYVEMGNVQFGFNRLSIIDLDAGSNQPFENSELGLTIVFNGEIYNYIEIREELVGLGYTFHTSSDTEVLLTAYYHYKEEIFNRFIGMWALAIFDKNENKVILSRDRFGIKPLYYMVQNGIFYFASEMKSLIIVKIEKKLNEIALHRYEILGLNTAKDGQTLVEGIFEFPAGNFAKVIENGIETKRYYHAPDDFTKLEKSECVELIREYFKSSVKLRMRADVPVALLLSGGLDSSAIAFAIDGMIESKEIEVQYVHAFTLNFVGFEKNEWEIVQENAKQLKPVVCHPINIDIENFKKEIPALIAQFDLPVLSVSHLLHSYAMREIRKQGFTVVLNGQGPDEVYGGYFPKDVGYLLLDYFKKSFSAGFEEMEHVKENWKLSYFSQFRYMLQGFIQYHFPKTFAFLKKYQVKHSLGIESGTEWVNKTMPLSYFDFISRRQVFESKFNGILQYEDMASMLNSIEMRSPFLDYRLVNLGLSLPSEYKLRNGYSKWILRKAFSSFLPKEICWSNWKLGYAVPKKLLLKDLLPNVADNESDWNNAWRQYNLKCWLEARGIE